MSRNVNRKLKAQLDSINIHFRYPWSVRNEFEGTLDGEAECEGQVHVTEDVSEHKRCTVVLHVDCADEQVKLF